MSPNDVDFCSLFRKAEIIIRPPITTPMIATTLQVNSMASILIRSSSDACGISWC
jgi:hypothetical protein